MSYIADFLLGMKDFLLGGVKGVANGIPRWAGWVFPFTTIVGIGAGLATGNAALALGILAGGPLAAGVVGGLVDMITGSFGSMLGGVNERVRNRGIATREQAAAEAREKAAAEARARTEAAKAAAAKPQRGASLDGPTTEIMAPGTTPTRLVEADQAIGRG